MDKETILKQIDPRVFYEPFIHEPTDNIEVGILCPFHDEKTPSCFVNVESGLFYCHGCGASGDMFDFYAQLHSLDVIKDFPQILSQIQTWVANQDTMIQPAKTVSQVAIEPIPMQLVHECNARLMHDTERLQWLQNKKGISIDTVRTYKLGYDGKRFWLPVFTMDNKQVICTNIRRYLPDGKPKFLNYKRGYGANRLYPGNIVPGNTMWLFEGELKALLARQLGLPAYSYTAGASSLGTSYECDVYDKRLIICYDIDSAGRQGAMAAAKQAYGIAKSVKVIRLPIDTPANGDLTNYIVDHKYTISDLKHLERITPEYVDAESLHLWDVIPPVGVVPEYINYAAKLTDAPVEFHLAVILTVLGTILGSKVTLNAWGRAVHPNIWSILISPSGFYHKSTAMNIGLNLLRTLDPGYILPDDFSQEALLDAIGGHPTGVLPADEFGAFVEKISASYNQGCKEMITRLHDQTRYTRLRKKKDDCVDIENISLNILSGTTVEWMFKSIAAGDVRGGFLPRFLFWPFYIKQERKGLTHNTFASPIDILDALKDIQTMTGEMYLDTILVERFSQWLLDHEDEFTDKNLSSDLQGFYARLGVYALKIAVLYQVSMEPGVYIISEQALDYAIRTIAFLKHRLIYFLNAELTTTKEGSELKRILRIVQQHSQGVAYPELLALSNLKVSSLHGLVETLVASHKISVKPGKTAAQTIYIAL